MLQMRNALLAVLSIISCSPPLAYSQVTRFMPTVAGGFGWRMIGPYRGGRTVSVAGSPQTTDRYYFGAVAGGVWQTVNSGLTWVPLFDQQPIASVGTVAIAPSDPNVIYVGTGEADIRSDLASGDGVYKSMDGGTSWDHMSLEDTKQISRIIVDPANPNIVLVAALGHAYGPNKQRGVFRSDDGGQNWKQVLFKDDQAGA